MKIIIRYKSGVNSFDIINDYPTMKVADHLEPLRTLIVDIVTEGDKDNVEHQNSIQESKNLLLQLGQDTRIRGIRRDKKLRLNATTTTEKRPENSKKMHKIQNKCIKFKKNA